MEVATRLEDISLPMTEQEYRDIDCLSYSFLSTIDSIGAGAKADTFEGNDATKLGNLIEEMVLGDYDKDKYHIADNPTPGEELQKVIDAVISAETQREDESLMEYFERALDNDNTLGFYSKWSNVKRAEKIVADGLGYIQYIAKSKGKIPVSTEMYQTALICVNTLKSHPFTRDIFKRKKGIDTMSQFKGQYQLKDGTIIKFMVDWLEVDHISNQVTPWDLKTGHKRPEYFQTAYHYRRYDIQDFLYTYGVEQVLKPYFPNYVFNNVKFVYINTVGIIKPLIFKGLGFHSSIGNGYLIGQRFYKGVHELIEEYKWYEKKGWDTDYPESIYKSNGVVRIDDSDMIEEPRRTALLL